MNQVEVITQPVSKLKDISTNEGPLEKLKDLVEKNPVVEDDKEKNAGDKGTPDTESHEDDVKYDYDGFEVPEGKIPIDGHFSTKELQELVIIAQDVGIIDKEIEVLVKNHNDVIGDKVVISQKREGTDDRDKDRGNEKKEQENEASDEETKKSDS